jgi:CubicO group peptidase (beta-lactamase class C family)
MRRLSVLVLSMLAAVVLSSCGGGGGGGDNSTPEAPYSYAYAVPIDAGDGWAVADAAGEGLNVDRLESMMRFINSAGQDEYLRNILIIRNNRLVFEEYFQDIHRGSLSHLQSATKSVVSAIFGIAVANGSVGSVGDALFDYFPEYQHLNNPDKAGVTLQHVLSMTPGFDWNEISTTVNAAENDNIAAHRSNNYIEYLLQKDIVTDPGTAWYYNSGCPMLLAGIVRNQAGIHIDEFAAQYLFGPMGIQSVRWEYQSDGLPLATGGLWMRARDSAKFGQLFLDGGNWDGQQLIPESWVTASWTGYSPQDPGEEYGYLWWMREQEGHQFWFASGYGGQLIVMVPDEEIVIVINADYSPDPNETGQRTANTWNLLRQYLLGSIQVNPRT